MNIKQAADFFNLTPDTLRYYEQVGVIPPVKRNHSGYRDYTTNDLNWIYLVKNLKSAGLSINSLVEFAALSQETHSKKVATAQKDILTKQLTEIEDKITEMLQVRDLLAYKIETYDEHVAKFKATHDPSEIIEPLWQWKKE